ncbi:sensor histidine kinase [Flavihumibacter fluvii]|uniref:sensor histidine kinase n=1 Tax=Flavihumibacter fluvii TaxID=2838157 RepID=UPI001BDDFD99|nr:sensor histidine kinase [Flavihumibacter fluvii]ULQ51875.1 CHASE3 domain-containing protein [Flavihumibacter fluvii]
MGNYLRNRRYSLLYLSIGFVLMLLVLGVFVLLTNKRLNALIAYSDQVEHTYQVIEKVEVLGNLAIDAETAVRGYILTKDSSYLEPLYLARRNIPGILDSLRKLMTDNDMQQVRLGMLRNTLILRLKILEDALTLVNAGTYDEVMIERMEKGKEMMNAFRSELDVIRKEEQNLLHTRFIQKETYQKLAPNIFRQLSMLVGVISLVLFIFLGIELFRRLRFQKALQQQLQALKQSNDELTQLAFAASHDLQEPVRKMRIFSDRLFMKQKHSLPAEDLMILGRIDFSARRLQGMLEDISNYMNLIGSEETKRWVVLQDIVAEVIQKNEPAIFTTGATIQIGRLPEFMAYPNQVSLLFQALLDNGLKFSKPGIPPEISIFSEQLKGEQLSNLLETSIHKSYWAIHFNDNGIGFDNAYRDKIFQLFRRLHNAEDFSGKGIGLAICQRVMSNHQGFIIAEGNPGKGASFILYFPAD